MHTRQRQLIILFILAVLLGASNWYANEHFLYFQFWWLDIVMHFLGGVFTGYALLWLYQHVLGAHVDQGKTRLLLIALIGTLIVGILWEVFESAAGIYQTQVGNLALDTTGDLIMDVLGAWLAFCMFQERKQEISVPVVETTD